MPSFKGSAEKASVIVTVNGGSSSIKFAAFSSAAPHEKLFGGQVERIGTPNARLITEQGDAATAQTSLLKQSAFDDCVQRIVNHIHQQTADAIIVGIGHRIVQGGVNLTAHQRITTETIAELRRTQPLDLDHLPREIALIEQFQKAFPGIPQVACFDTAFHREMPRVAQLLPIPRRYLDAGVRRFGFHGLSYTYLLSQFAVLAGPEAAKGRLIFAHLGSGASMAAVSNGKPIDTTMAFTPTAGLVMGTRPGDMDPGLLIYLMKAESASADAMDRFISQQCGLLGVSQRSSDVRDLLTASATDHRAAEAVELFCYAAKKQLCAMMSTLGGLDTLIFSGGIGEHSPEIRAAICRDLDFLGLKLDDAKNSRGDGTVSAEDSRIQVWIIPTNEELVIARIVDSILDLSESAASSIRNRAGKI